MDETLQAVNHQSVRLKTDIRVLQKERDSLKHEVAVLHKQLQNANDKVRVFSYLLFNTLNYKSNWLFSPQNQFQYLIHC